MSYSKAINSQEGRTGSLFERPFKRKEINCIKYLSYLIQYIHNNPVHHDIIRNIDDWPFSSYNRMLMQKPSKLCREEVFECFGGRDRYIRQHKKFLDIIKIDGLIIDEYRLKKPDRSWRSVRYQKPCLIFLLFRK